MKIHMATDHAGFEMKEFLKDELTRMGYDIVDYGAKSLNNDDDYPDFVTPAAEAVVADDDSMGIILGGSGQGEAMCANRVHGVYAAVYYGDLKPIKAIDVFGEDIEHPYEIIRVTRKHNNANILALGARFLTNEDALEAVKIFLGTEFSNHERNIRRILSF